MIAHEIYRNAKTLLTNEAKQARKHHPKDKPMQREIINNQADQQRRQFDFYRMKETISDKQCAQMCNWIDAAAINLHP